MKRVWVIQSIAMAGLMLLPAPPLMAQAAPDASILQLSAEARIAKLQVDYGAPMSAPEKTRIGNVCKTVQGILQQYTTRSKAAAEKEATIHSGVISRMGTLQSHFAVSMIEFPEFGQVITDYSRHADGLKAAYELHNSLLGDALGMDCSANPEGFKAVIAAARAAQPDVAAKRIAARAYLDGNARPAIDLLKAKVPTAQPTPTEGTAEVQR